MYIWSAITHFYAFPSFWHPCLCAVFSIFTLGRIDISQFNYTYNSSNLPQIWPKTTLLSISNLTQLADILSRVGELDTMGVWAILLES